MSRPNFFIVGQPKSGTTAFYDFLRQHPEIFAPERKEVHYFCRDFHEENAAFHGRCLHFPIRTEPEYLALFGEWQGERLVGEASVHYLFSRVAAEEIHRFDPDAKIIIFLRNPVDFLYSWHAHSLLSNGETLESFEEALAAEEPRKRGEQLTPLVKVPSYLYYQERIRYAEQIRRYQALFPPEQLHIVIYDDFVKDIGGVYEGILRFLGVAPDYRPEFKVINPRKRLRFKPLANLTKMPGVQQALRVAVPKSLRVRLGLPAVYKLLFHGRDRSGPMAAATRRELMERTRPQVEEVSELLGRDLLALWGYDAAVPAATPAGS